MIKRKIKETQNKSEYNPKVIESYWQKIWEKEKIYEPDLGKAKRPFYNLMMFPYPSAEGLHVGNMYAFCGSDIFGRYMRMKDFDVFEPIGLDGFGIHSENYALKISEHPINVAKRTEANFYRQLHATGNAYDWSCRLETYDTNYYKWTQWIFIKMFQAGLAYRAKSLVNWCPSCKTVLADEQVIKKLKVKKANTKETEEIFVCERCETEIVKKELAQWFFRITNYAQRLLDHLDHLDWSEKVKTIQKNWIGKSEGVEIMFPFDAGNRFDTESTDSIRVFTTRPDTIFGVTFIVLAPQHPLVIKIINNVNGLLKQQIQKYVDYSFEKAEAKGVSNQKIDEKTGIFTGFYCINPLSKRKVPIYVADYVLTTYGTGAVMGVPAHDQRDWEFARKYGIDIVQVIKGVDESANDDISRRAFTEDGVLINSDKFNNLSSKYAIIILIKYIEEHHIGKKETLWHLRDWLISRQRYWGPPIPMIYCEECAKRGKSGQQTANGKQQLANNGWYPVLEKDLPVELPYIKNFKPTGAGVAPLAQDKNFMKVRCPGCGSWAKRETDVSDTFLDSAWYFLRYPSVKIEDLKLKIENLPWDREITRQWLPVDMYIGGAEHAVLHLLYSRFLTMVFKDLRLVDFEEPFTKFRAHGLLIAQGAKMSKSKGNIVNPDAYIEKFGADTLRCYLMFCGRFSEGGDFQDTGIEGMHRFLKRVWRLVVNAGPVTTFPSASRESSEPLQLSRSSKSEVLRAVGSPSSRATRVSSGSLYMMHKTIKKVTEDIEGLNYNTAISAMMEWVNFLEDKEEVDPATRIKISGEEIKNLLLLLAPFAPHMTEELWNRLNGKLKMESGKLFSIHLQLWPEYDQKLAQSAKITLVVQVNGKVRDRIEIERGIEEKEAQKAALILPKIANFIGKSKIVKTVFVPDRLINFVTSE